MLDCHIIVKNKIIMTNYEEFKQIVCNDKVMIFRQYLPNDEQPVVIQNVYLVFVVCFLH